MYEKIKKFYELGLWNEEMVQNALKKGIITEDEYRKIII